jgi:hypothetical protein
MKHFLLLFSYMGIFLLLRSKIWNCLTSWELVDTLYEWYGVWCDSKDTHNTTYVENIVTIQSSTINMGEEPI